MLKAVVIMLKSLVGIKRWINIYAFDFARELLFERFESEKVVAEDETVIEEVVISHTVRRVIGVLRVFEQDTRLKPRSVLLPDPGEFELWLLVHALFELAKLVRPRSSSVTYCGSTIVAKSD